MAVVSALVPLFLANPQLYKKDIAPTGVSAKERPENEQLRCPGRWRWSGMRHPPPQIQQNEHRFLQTAVNG